MFSVHSSDTFCPAPAHLILSSPGLRGSRLPAAPAHRGLIVLSVPEQGQAYLSEGVERHKSMKNEGES